MVVLQYPDGKDKQEDRRRYAAAEYVLKVGIRLDENLVGQPQGKDRYEYTK